MSKTIADFLGMGKEKLPSHKTFFLDDVLEKNPIQYCPNCDSSSINRLRTHNPEGADYQCGYCRITYEIVYSIRREY